MESNKEKIKRLASSGLMVAFAVFLVVSSCSAPKRAPYAEPVSMPTEELESGRVLFNEYCATCHPGGMSGVGLAIINKPLPASFIRFQIRKGVGVMPDFDEDVLTDEQVEHIAEYLVYLRKKDSGEKED